MVKHAIATLVFLALPACAIIDSSEGPDKITVTARGPVLFMDQVKLAEEALKAGKDLCDAKGTRGNKFKSLALKEAVDLIGSVVGWWPRNSHTLSVQCQ